MKLDATDRAILSALQKDAGLSNKELARKIRLAHHLEKDVESFRHQLRARPEVVNAYYVSGGVDFLVHVAVRDVAHLRTLGVEAFTSHRLVAHVETSLIFEHERSKGLPDLTG